MVQSIFTKQRRTTLILGGLILLAFALSIPGSLRDAFHRGGLYMFSLSFLEDIPKRLAGPGRFRFIMQPAVAIVLGILAGLADARSGLPPYVYGLVFHRELRGQLAKSALTGVANLVLMGILLDMIFQWVILGAAYPGAALVVGPVLIMFPYALARAFSNRLARWMKRFE